MIKCAFVYHYFTLKISFLQRKSKKIRPDSGGELRVLTAAKTRQKTGSLRIGEKSAIEKAD